MQRTASWAPHASSGPSVGSGTTGNVSRLCIVAVWNTVLTPGATFVRRSGLYDIYSVGVGTSEFSSAS